MKIEEIKTRHAAEIIKIEREEQAMNECPSPKPERVSYIAGAPNRDGYYLAKYAKKYPDRHPFEAAFEVYKAWVPLIICAEDWKGSCRSLFPAEINKVAKEQSSICNGQMWASVYLNQGKGYCGHQLQFWARLSSGLIHVLVELQPEWKWLPQTSFRYDSNGDCITSKVSPCCIGEDALVKWWSPPGSYNLEYTWADKHNFHAFASNYIPEDAMP